jgi:hypothetical protein
MVSKQQVGKNGINQSLIWILWCYLFWDYSNPLFSGGWGNLLVLLFNFTPIFFRQIFN